MNSAAAETPTTNPSPAGDGALLAESAWAVDPERETLVVAAQKLMKLEDESVISILLDAGERNAGLLPVRGFYSHHNNFALTLHIDDMWTEFLKNLARCVVPEYEEEDGPDERYMTTELVARFPDGMTQGALGKALRVGFGLEKWHSRRRRDPFYRKMKIEIPQNNQDKEKLS